MTIPDDTAVTESFVNGADNNQLLDSLALLNARITCDQHDLLGLLAEADKRQLYVSDGAKDASSWVAARLGISRFRARRLLGAAHSLPRLPLLSGALRRGELSLDKTVELCRFATPQDEGELISWAAKVAVATIRERADEACRQPVSEASDIQSSQNLCWWVFADGKEMGFEARLPLEAGRVVAQALDEVAQGLPELPGQDIDARRADALVVLACGSASSPRAALSVHVDLDTITAGGGARLAGGGIIPSLVAERVACDSDVTVVLEDRHGDAVGIGQRSRSVSPRLMELLSDRDHRRCTFPGCELTRFLEAHHVKWWSEGGATDLANLLLVCHFHHRLVHEHGWSVVRTPGGTAQWMRPDGSRYAPGLSPPQMLQLA